jgi:glutamate mutase epsilon subunit
MALGRSRWPDVVAGLLSTMRARPGYRDPAAVAASSLIPVYRSWQTGLSEDATRAYLVVAWSGTPANRADAGLFRQSVATTGRVTRDEDGEVRCLAVAQVGESEFGDVAATEAAAFTILADVEDALRVDPTLGLSPNPRLVVELMEAAAIRSYPAAGCVSEIEFTVRYRARI